MSLTKINSNSYSTLDATKLTGNLPAISGSSLTGISGGKVKKVTSADFTGDTHTTSSSYSTLFTLSVTPTATTSNLLLIMSTNYQLYGNGAGRYANGSILLSSEHTGSAVTVATQGYTNDNMGNSDTFYSEVSGSLSAYYNPNTTSAFDINVRFKQRGNGRIRCFGNSTGDPFNPSAFRLTAIEIGA